MPFFPVRLKGGIMGDCAAVAGKSFYRTPLGHEKFSGPPPAGFTPRVFFGRLLGRLLFLNFLFLTACASFDDPYAFDITLSRYQEKNYVMPKICRPLNYPNPPKVAETALEACLKWIAQQKQRARLTIGQPRDYRLSVKKIKTAYFMCPLDAFVQEQFICLLHPNKPMNFIYRHKEDPPVVLATGS